MTCHCAAIVLPTACPAERKSAKIGAGLLVADQQVITPSGIMPQEDDNLPGWPRWLSGRAVQSSGRPSHPKAALLCCQLLGLPIGICAKQKHEEKEGHKHANSVGFHRLIVPARPFGPRIGE